MTRPMLVIVPSRGRPGNVRRLEESLSDTEVSDVEFLYAVDPDDPCLGEYIDIDSPRIWIMHKRLYLGGTLNYLALLNASKYDVIGFMGDDHLPRTRHWDKNILNVMDQDRPMVVYGNDLLQRDALPTSVFISSSVIRALGYMCPPGLRHLWIDNAWKTLGKELGTLTYLNDTVIEHMHPVAGKAAWDEGYSRVNSGEQNNADRQEYERWIREDLDFAVSSIWSVYA